MKISEKLDEIIKLNSDRMKELGNIKISNSKRMGIYEVEISEEQKERIRVKRQKDINERYNSEISMIYAEINKQILKDGNTGLMNPFI